MHTTMIIYLHTRVRSGGEGKPAVAKKAAKEFSAAFFPHHHKSTWANDGDEA